MAEWRLKKVNEIDYLKNETEGGEEEGRMTGHPLYSSFLFYPLWSERPPDRTVVLSDGSEDKCT